MPKFEKLEDAQKWADEHEPELAKAAELSKQVAALNRENAERRLANEKLEKEFGELRDSGKSAARKEAEAAVKAEFDSKSKEQEGKYAAEIRRLSLERAALAAGVKADKIEYAVKLLPADVDPAKAAEPLASLLKDFPTLAGVPPAGGPSPLPSSKGGPGPDLAAKVAAGQPVELAELTKR